MAYEIQHETICDGWINTWTDDVGRPLVFPFREEAETALAHYLDDCREAVPLGELTDFDETDYRIAELPSPEQS